MQKQINERIKSLITDKSPNSIDEVSRASIEINGASKLKIVTGDRDIYPLWASAYEAIAEVSQNMGIDNVVITNPCHNQFIEFTPSILLDDIAKTNQKDRFST
jgi:hypothetical protein